MKTIAFWTLDATVLFALSMVYLHQGYQRKNPLFAVWLFNGVLMQLIGAWSLAAGRPPWVNRVRLVDDLLDVERLARGRIELRKHPIEIAAVIAAAVETSRPALDARGHQLDISIPKEPIFVDGDLTRLRQVLANLLDNAGKYSPPASVIRLSAEHADSEVVIRVSDNGMGIAPELLATLFDLYAQGKPTPGAELQDFGIGLALVRQIVEMHGGSVSATSAGLGKGSEFIVRLPISRERSGTAKSGGAAKLRRTE